MSLKTMRFLSQALLAFSLLSLPAVRLAAETCGEPLTLYGQQDGVAPGSGVLFQGAAPTQEPDERDSQAADDFGVPVGEVWSVETVRLEAFAATPPAEPPAGVRISFHADDGGKPGSVVCTYANVVPQALAAGGLAGVLRLDLSLPSACTLCSGTVYWLSLQALGPQPLTYHWRQRSVANAAPAVWRNPEDGLGTGCTGWSAPSFCGQGDGVSPDLIFSLAGRKRVLRFVKGDFNGDLCADLVFQSQISGEVKIWYMNGTVRVSEEAISPQPPGGWHVAGTHDFNRDGRTDLVVQDEQENVWLWTMDGAKRLGETPIVLDSEPAPQPGHRLLGTVDLDHAGDPDLVCHGSKGTVIIWDTQWTAQPEVWRRVGEVFLDGEPTAETWKVQAAADFDGDLNLDVLVSDPGSSEVQLWRFDANLSYLGSRPTTPSAPGSSEWKVVAAADFGAGPAGPDSPAPVCGVLDVVWQNATSSKTVIWHLNADQERTGGVFTTPDGPGPGWDVVGPR